MSEEIEVDAEDAPQERDFEAEAKELGWVPKEEFRGPEDKWSDAEEYVRRGEEILPIVRANNKKLIEKTQKQEAELAEMRKTLDEFKGWRTQTEKRAYEQAMKNIESRQRQAVEEQDVEAFEEAVKDKESLVTRTTEAQEPQPDPVAAAWTKENDWFNTDPVMQQFAIAHHGQLLKEKPGLSLSENLEEVTEEVRRRFPEKFGNPRREKPNRVEGGGTPSGRSGKKGYADLPPEAKAACDRFVKQGLMTKEEYVKDFDWSE